MRKFLTIVFLFLFLSGCSKGYSLEFGSWAYITYDEAAGRRVEFLDIDKNTFSVLDNKNYARDKNKVFYQNEIIIDADPNSFEVINNDGYSKDSNYVFFYSTKIIGANPKTFVYLDYPYSKDDKKVYYGTLPMFVKNINEFKVTKRGKGKRVSTIDYFLSSNPEYSFIDSNKYPYVGYASGGKGETNDQKFEGYQLVE